MIECECVTKKWGNSLGVVIPKEVVRNEHIKEHEKIRFLVIKEDKTLKDTFGVIKNLRKPTQQIKDELRGELYND